MKISAQITMVALVLTAAAGTAFAGNCGSRGKCRPTYYQPQPVYQEPVEEPILEAIPVDCEVQVQHPITFKWVTVKQFEDLNAADSYLEQVEQRYWVTYNWAGSAKTSYLEATDKISAREKVTALRRSGSRIVAVKPVEAQVVQTEIEPLLAADDEAEDLALANSPVPQDLQPLLGVWESVSATAAGDTQKIVMTLNADGTANIAAPTANGGRAELTRDFEVDEAGNFNLTDGDAVLSLGKVLSANADKVVLERPDGLVAFVRP